MKYTNAIEKQINKIYEQVFKQVFNKQRLSSVAKGNKQAIQQAVLNLQKSDKYNEFAQKFAKKLALKGLLEQRGIWRKFFNAAKHTRHIVLPSTYKEFEKNILKNVMKENFKMIKNIPQHVLETYQLKVINTAIKQVAEGSLGRKAFTKILKEHGAKNAKLIARTETAKLQTAILQNRAQDLGSVAYVWRSSHDRRTRPSHKAMNNVVVFWRNKLEEKPKLDKMYGNAGEFPNCRCTPQPILDEDDLTLSMYEVYDYRTHKIISMRRVDIIKLLKRENCKI